jgi:hypothetical protein
MKNMSTCLTLAILALCLPGKAWALATEDFGNANASNAAGNELNYKEWQGIVPLMNHSSRVYHWWCNGSEQFYYRGDTATLNDALQKFAAAKADVHEVLLQPGPGITHSFHARTIPYNWSLHVQGGISRHLTTLPDGNKIWSKFLTMAVCVGGDIALEKIRIPAGVSVVDLADLSRRYREALASKDKTVRGSGAGELAGLDPYDAENLAAIAKLLKDDDEWVQRCAVGAVTHFDKKAESVLPALREMLVTRNKQLKDCVKNAIEEIQQAKDTSAAEKEHRSMQEQIHKFCEQRSQR